MLRSQLYLMFQKKSFLISFSIMMAIASFLPSIYFFLSYFGFFKDYGQDISLFLEQIKNPYLFYAYSDFTFYMYYFIPVILSLPFSLSFCVEKRCGYSSLLISRGGIKKYIFSKSVCCLCGGFICFFIPSIINILLNKCLIKEATDTYCLSSSEISNAILNSISKGKETSKEWIFSIEHPIGALLKSAFLISIFAGVCSLTIYTISLYLQKQPYLASFPLIVILLTFYIFDPQVQAPSINPLMYACLGYRKCYSIMYYICFILIATFINYVFILAKSRKDVI